MFIKFYNLTEILLPDLLHNEIHFESKHYYVFIQKQIVGIYFALISDCYFQTILLLKHKICFTRFIKVFRFLSHAEFVVSFAKLHKSVYPVR